MQQIDDVGKEKFRWDIVSWILQIVKQLKYSTAEPMQFNSQMSCSR